MKKFSDALGIEYEEKPAKAEVELLPAIVETKTESNPDQEEDYKLARGTFRALIEKGNEAIEGISDLAATSESPRAYEVMATLMKTVAETTKDLYDLQKKTKELKSDGNIKKLDETNITVDKAVFVGTTAELLKKIKNEQT